MWRKMDCSEREWWSNKRDSGDEESGGLIFWFQLFLQPNWNFSLFLNCLLKLSLYINSQHIHHWFLLVLVRFVSLATKRILCKTEDFPEKVKFELSLKGRRSLRCFIFWLSSQAWATRENESNHISVVILYFEKIKIAFPLIILEVWHFQIIQKKINVYPLSLHNLTLQK